MRLSTVCVLMFLLVACSRPLGVLSEETMANVLVDIHLTNAALNIRIPDDQKALKQKYTDAVFEKHGTTSEQFKESIDWYSKNPKKMEAVYEEVESRLTQMETDVNNYVYHPQLNPANDSLDTINAWRQKMAKKIMAQSADSLRFAWDDSLVFCEGDTLVWSFVIAANEPDSGATSAVKFGVNYANGIADTLVYHLQNGNRKRKITFRHVAQAKPTKIWGVIFEPTSAADSQIVAIDTVSMLRIFNKNRFPLYPTWQQYFDSIQNPKVDKKSEKIRSKSPKNR